MAGSIEKTVFISYRHTNRPWALFIFQYLTNNGYDVFIDFQTINSGNFESVILANIKARAHFLVILTPSALENCKNSDDWLRCEIETAMDEKRNIVPLMVEGFDFGSPLIKRALTGKLAGLSKINGLRIPDDYPFEAMNRLRERYLSIALADVALPKLKAEEQKITDTKIQAASEAAPVQKKQLTAQTWFERAYVFQSEKNLDEALRCYSEAIRIDPNLNAAHNNLGVIFVDLKRYDEAEAAFRKAIELNPSSPETYSNLANLLSDQNLKRYDEAKAAFYKAIELNPLLPEAYSNLGNLLRNLKRYDEAEAAYRNAIELNPSLPEAYSNLGNLLSDENLERYDEAEAAFHKAIELNPSLPEAYSNLGNLLRNLKRYDEAEAAFHKAIELNPLLPEAYSNLGILLRNLKRYDEAEAAYRKGIELNLSLPETYYNLGVLLRNLKRYDEAEAAYRKAIELNPSDAAVYYNLGNVLRNLKRYDEAEAAYRKAIELNPSLPEAYNNLVIFLRLIHRSEDAIPLLGKLIEINPDDFNPYLAIASINKQLGRTILPELLEKARQFMPEDDWYNRACLESVCDHFDSAFEYLQKDAQRDGFNPRLAWDDPDLQWLRDDPRFVAIVGEKPAQE